MADNIMDIERDFDKILYQIKHLKDSCHKNDFSITMVSLKCVYIKEINLGSQGDGG